MNPEFFIRKVHASTPANKLQKALLDMLPAYYNQLTQEPAVVMERLTSRVNYINRQFPRCTPMKVGFHPKGQYIRPGGEQGERTDQQQGLKNGWRIMISGLAELEIIPVAGRLSVAGPDPYALPFPKPTTAEIPAHQMTVFG